MKVTVDANILFACLISDGETRRLWFHPELKLFAPKFIFAEFFKYRKLLEKKFGFPKEDFERLLNLAISQVELIPDFELNPFLPASIFLIDDPKDWLYLACALKEDTLIWSNDKGFKRQKRVKTKTTTEMIDELGTL